MYRNQSTDLLWKSMVRFLYDRDLRRERVMTLFTDHTPKVCSYMLQSRIHFFSIWLFFSRISTIHNTGGEGEGYLLISFLPLSPTSQSSPPRIADSRTRSENFWYTMFRSQSFYTCTGSCYC